MLYASALGRYGQYKVMNRAIYTMMRIRQKIVASNVYMKGFCVGKFRMVVIVQVDKISLFRCDSKEGQKRSRKKRKKKIDLAV